jgi:tetratricopeptide (TPR) repeat protein
LNIVDWNSRKTIELAERESAHRQNKFYLGSAYGLLSRVHLMRQELWDGYWAARNCRSYLEEVLKEDSTFYDAYVGLGVIEYYPSRLTGMQSFLSWLGGMGGDGEKGIEYFRKAAANGDLLKTEATLILAYVARNFEADFAIADALFSSLQDEFPGNGFFKTQGLQAKLGMRIETEGISFLREDLHGARNEYRITSSGVLNAMAYAFMGRGDHATARDIFELNIELFPDEANPHDSIAECYALIGNNEEAVRHSRIALEKLPGDTTISDEFRENLREILQDRLKALGATPGV